MRGPIGVQTSAAEPTAETEADDRARELGGEFLEKPIRLEELLKAVSRHLPLPRR